MKGVPYSPMWQTLKNKLQCERGVMENTLILWMLLLGVTEAAYLAAFFLDRSFHFFSFLAFYLWCVLLLLGGGYIVWSQSKLRKTLPKVVGRSDKANLILLLIFVTIVFVQISIISNGALKYPQGETTAETMNVFLTNEVMWQQNPLTGQAYEAGVPTRIQILLLPAFYSAICEIFGITVPFLLMKAVPIAILLIAYMAYASLGKALFGSNHTRRRIFLLIVALIFSFGAYAEGVDGFGLRYSGFAGVTIRNVILLPTTISSLLRRDWILLIACIATEAIIVWTL
ncbi:MAG: DUF6077 domain-containing protein, partial [Lachnospiraceae bacterium]|nr:DUF6077 domain-containing protein [Lachnospiraceae bacterium]